MYDIEQHFPQHLQIVVDTTAYQQLFVAKNHEVEHQTAHNVVPQKNTCGRNPTKQVNLKGLFNARICDLYNNRYMSPRPDVTTLEIPVQGAGDWCSTDYKPTLTDTTNVVFTSLWDNYPDSVEIPIGVKAKYLNLSLFGTTNWMQSHIINGTISIVYSDGSNSIVSLVNPDNWLPNDKLVHIKIPTDKHKQLKSIVIRTLSNDIVIGVTSVTIHY